jgi:deoxyribodipyrimidine photo-lyase
MGLRIVWLRRDLRLADQAAFAAAAAGAVVPVYVLDDETPGDRRLGGAARWWLHGSLAALDAALRRRGSRLILRSGRSAEVLAGLVLETGAEAVHAIRHYEPWWRGAEAELAERCSLVLHDGNYLLPPGSVSNGQGDPYRIFTPFHRAASPLLPPPQPLAEPALQAPATWPASELLDDWRLLPTRPDWAGGLRSSWRPGEDAARERLAEFAAHAHAYHSARNLPSQDGSSRLSPHLHWGELSPASVWHALADVEGEGGDSFRRELVWRDFAQSLIAAWPDYPEASFRRDLAALPWRDPASDETARRDFRAWTRGRTGYPLVDAGMRQLWVTGWMHNRVRMVAASFLVKHLLIDWRAGERWFWDTLVDADYANNGVNWQWVAGTGADASPFHRIMAPLLQSAKFDTAGYIRQWVPELAPLTDAAIHDPDPPPPGYPAKLIGHREARARALAFPSRAGAPLSG